MKRVEQFLAVITGPTAIGKTEIAMAVAKSLNGEIVSADSMQVYRHMDIGTAKPGPEERREVPHHMIDVVDPDEPFSVARFQEGAREAIIRIREKGRLPLLVGGTGLYIRAVADNLMFPDKGEDQGLREALKREAMEKGSEYLYAKLLNVDPDGAKTIHPNDVRRIIRALEVYHLTDRPISELQKLRGQPHSSYNLAMVGLRCNRDSLYARIDARVDRMIELGLVAEVKHLVDMGYGDCIISMQALGYKEIIRHLRSEITLDEAVRIIKRDTRHYAKRQFTWFKKDPRIEWVDLDEYPYTRDAAYKVQSVIESKLKIHPFHHRRI